MKKLIAMLIGAFGLRSVLVTYHKSRLGSALITMKQFDTETTMPVWCSQRFQRHFRALRRLGFVVEREFVLERPPSIAVIATAPFAS